MGRAKLGLKRVELNNFSRGYFPNKEFDDIPDGGSSDCKHVIWFQSDLRKMFGMDRINSSAVSNINGCGVFYLDVNGATKRTAVFGSGFYEDVAGTWTDRTGTVTITDGANNLVQAINHQQGSNKYAIYVNGVNPPWKWTGSGNAAVLGGTPPANFTSIAKYHDTIFGSYGELNYFSDTGDPETWNSTRWVLRFDKDIKSQHDNGQKLAVLMDDHIGSISGYSYLDFQQEESEIATVGCVGRLAATKAYFGKNDTRVIATISRDGVYTIDEAFGYQRLFGDDYFSQFNQTSLSKAVCAYCRIDNLLYVAIPNDSATEMDYLVVVDMISGAIWPCPNIHSNYIRAMASMKDDDGNEFIYFVDKNGYAFKFNKETKNYHTGSASQAIDARWKSKTFDLKDVHSFREATMLADAVGNWNVTMAVAFGLTTLDGTSGSISLLGEGDLLGSTFILGASTLTSSDYIFEVLSDVGGFGRYMAITVSNNSVDESFNIRKIEIQMKRRRQGGSDK